MNNRFRNHKVSDGTTVVTAESDEPGSTTEVHVNVDEEPKRGKIATMIVSAMGVLSALAAAGATLSVGHSGAQTSNALQELADNSAEQTQMQMNLAHQEQVLPVRVEVNPVDGTAPEGYELVEVQVTNPGDAMLMDVTVHLPEGSLVRDGDEVLRTNALDAGVVVDDFSQEVLVPEGADLSGVSASFTTSWDQRERWTVLPDDAPVLRSCVFPGGEGEDLEVALSEVKDVRSRTWIGCDVVFDEAAAGGIAGLEGVPGAGAVGDAVSDAGDKLKDAAGGVLGEDGDGAAAVPARARQTGDGAVDPVEVKSEVLDGDELAGLGGEEVLVEKQ
mgnify:CR=1 FL=1